MRTLMLTAVLLLAVVGGIKAQEKTEDIVFSSVEEMPEFPGGEDSLNKFFRRNIEFPAELRLVNYKSSVLLSFEVNRSGKVINLKLLQTSGHDKLDKEVMRVANLMPLWVPGKDNGKTVNVLVYQPLEISQ